MVVSFHPAGPRSTNWSFESPITFYSFLSGNDAIMIHDDDLLVHEVIPTTGILLKVPQGADLMNEFI